MNTTIAISKELREEIIEFGSKGETYEDILKKLVQSAKERQLRDLLMDETNTIPVKEALEKAKKRW